MAMNGDVLGDAIRAAVDAAVAGGGAVDRSAMFRAIGGAIVAHIAANATVATTIQLGSVATGAMGGGPGVPVTGTATGTIT